MKNAKDIVRSLQMQPQFTKLRNFRCIDTIMSMFLPTVRRFVDFCYIKNDTLFVVLNHNAGKQEFDNSIKMIKDVLKSLKPQECESLQINDIKAFVTHKRKQKSSALFTPTTIPLYQERSKGAFDTECFNDERLKNVALEIQSIIRKRNR